MVKEFNYRGRELGDLKSIGDRPEDMMGVRRWKDRVFLAARSQLCPIPDEVVNYYSLEYKKAHPKARNPEKIRREGMKMAVRRYLQCNFVLKRLILAPIEESNQELYRAMLRPVSRVKGEYPNPNLKKQFLPDGFEREMQLGSTLYGYALPRILGVWFWENQEGDPQERISRGLEIVEKLSKQREIVSPIEFMVKLAERLVGVGADPERLLGHMLAKSFLKEEGCKTMFRQTIETMREKAPNLWRRYDQMTMEERGNREIVDPMDFE